MRYLTGLMVVALLSFAVACSDDDNPKNDTGVTPDTGADMMEADGATPDQGADQAVADQGQGDTAAPDQGGGDAADPCAATGTGSGTVKGAVKMKASVTCDANDTAKDCKGTLIVGVVCVPNPGNPAVFVVKTMASVTSADLSGGASVAYEVQNVPVGNWFTIAYLDDDENGGNAPSAGDPINMDPYPATAVTDGNDTTLADIDLDIRCGPPFCN